LFAFLGSNKNGKPLLSLDIRRAQRGPWNNLCQIDGFMQWANPGPLFKCRLKPTGETTVSKIERPTEAEIASVNARQKIILKNEELREQSNQLTIPDLGLIARTIDKKWAETQLIPAGLIPSFEKENYNSINHSEVRRMVDKIKNAPLEKQLDYRAQTEKELWKRKREQQRVAAFPNDKTLYDVILDSGRDVMDLD
jgi:hypothetical protein